MDCLTDDTISYLTEIIMFKNYKLLSSFITCHRIKSIIDKIVNDKLKINYKQIIRNNYLEYPLQSYDNLYKTYGGNFTIGPEKLNFLLSIVIENNNIELYKIFHKTLPNFMKLDRTQKHIFDSCLEHSTIIDTMIDLILDDSIKLTIFQYCLRNHYNSITKYQKELKNIIINKEYKDELIKFCLIYDDINILNLVIDESNVNELLIRSMVISGTKITKNIIDNYRYNKTFVIDYFKNLDVTYPKQEIMNLLI